MLLSQDVIRREVLYASENTKHPTIELISLMTTFGWTHGYDNVIIEGILGSRKNGEKLKELIETADEPHVFYFDISFEETLRRHQTKHNAHEFGEKEMREWWLEKDYLGTKEESLITEEMTIDQALGHILESIMPKTTTNLERK